ncbi:hypothetical protein EC513_03715 [Helicobacter pylori]|nr:hypothetical protein EC513_03715 [Helicobacter pylori]
MFFIFALMPNFSDAFKKKRKPPPSSHALAALLALWLAFQKGLKTLASRILSLKVLGTIV